MTKLNNVIKYIKKYSNTNHWIGKGYESGYHTLKIEDTKLNGQRNPEQRLLNVNYNFTDKKVLDLGCNKGGMLFEIQDKVKYAVGIDCNSSLINCCNLLKSYKKANNLNFYVHNLDNMDIEDLNLYGPFDIALMLSMSIWIKEWKTYIDWIGTNCKTCLFETNGSNQQEQINFLSNYFNIEIVNNQSLDDKRNKNRKLLLCNK